MTQKTRLKPVISTGIILILSISLAGCSSVRQGRLRQAITSKYSRQDFVVKGEVKGEFGKAVIMSPGSDPELVFHAERDENGDVIDNYAERMISAEAAETATQAAGNDLRCFIWCEAVSGNADPLPGTSAADFFSDNPEAFMDMIIIFDGTAYGPEEAYTYIEKAVSGVPYAKGRIYAVLTDPESQFELKGYLTSHDAVYKDGLEMIDEGSVSSIGYSNGKIDGTLWDFIESFNIS